MSLGDFMMFKNHKNVSNVISVDKYASSGPYDMKFIESYARRMLHRIETEWSLTQTKSSSSKVMHSILENFILSCNVYTKFLQSTVVLGGIGADKLLGQSTHRLSHVLRCWEPMYALGEFIEHTTEPMGDKVNSFRSNNSDNFDDSNDSDNFDINDSLDEDFNRNADLSADTEEFQTEDKSCYSRSKDRMDFDTRRRLKFNQMVFHVYEFLINSDMRLPYQLLPDDVRDVLRAYYFGAALFKLQDFNDFNNFKNRHFKTRILDSLVFYFTDITCDELYRQGVDVSVFGKYTCEYTPSYAVDATRGIIKSLSDIMQLDTPYLKDIKVPLIGVINCCDSYWQTGIFPDKVSPKIGFCVKKILQDLKSAGLELKSGNWGSIFSKYRTRDNLDDLKPVDVFDTYLKVLDTKRSITARDITFVKRWFTDFQVIDHSSIYSLLDDVRYLTGVIADLQVECQQTEFDKVKDAAMGSKAGAVFDKFISEFGKGSQDTPEGETSQFTDRHVDYNSVFDEFNDYDVVTSGETVSNTEFVEAILDWIDIIKGNPNCRLEFSIVPTKSKNREPVASGDFEMFGVFKKDIDPELKDIVLRLNRDVQNLLPQKYSLIIYPNNHIYGDPVEISLKNGYSLIMTEKLSHEYYNVVRRYEKLFKSACENSGHRVSSNRGAGFNKRSFGRNSVDTGRADQYRAASGRFNESSYKNSSSSRQNVNTRTGTTQQGTAVSDLINMYNKQSGMEADQVSRDGGQPDISNSGAGFNASVDANQHQAGVAQSQASQSGCSVGRQAQSGSNQFKRNSNVKSTIAKDSERSTWNPETIQPGVVDNNSVDVVSEQKSTVAESKPSIDESKSSVVSEPSKPKYEENSVEDWDNSKSGFGAQADRAMTAGKRYADMLRSAFKDENARKKESSAEAFKKQFTSSMFDDLIDSEEITEESKSELKSTSTVNSNLGTENFESSTNRVSGELKSSKSNLDSILGDLGDLDESDNSDEIDVAGFMRDTSNVEGILRLSRHSEAVIKKFFALYDKSVSMCKEGLKITLSDLENVDVSQSTGYLGRFVETLRTADTQVLPELLEDQYKLIKSIIGTLPDASVDTSIKRYLQATLLSAFTEVAKDLNVEFKIL